MLSGKRRPKKGTYDDGRGEADISQITSRFAEIIPPYHRRENCTGILKDKRLDFRVAQMPSADKFQLHIYAALAEQEREFISQRTKAALREAKARGQRLGGLRDKTMKRNAAVRANAVARAQKVAGIVVPLRGAGKTFREIAGELNRAGVRTARGGSWQPSQVMRVLERLGA